MSNAVRKPFHPVDENRLLQQQNKQSLQRRKRRYGIKTVGSGNASVGSLESIADETGYDFLTNPKPAPKLDIDTKTKKIWNSRTKTPKISNLTAALFKQPCGVSESDIISSSQQGITANVLVTSQSQHQQMIRSSETLRRQAVTSDSSLYPGHHRVGRNDTLLPLNRSRRVNKGEEEKYSSGASRSYAHKGALETIVEGTNEDENDSPNLPRNNETTEQDQDESKPSLH
jgi:hypothetical protein